MLSDKLSKLKNHSIFKTSSPELLQCLREKNKNQEPFFLLPTKYISDESANLGQAISKINNRSIKGQETYRTFFCNSLIEALNGTIKIIRHNGYLNHSKGKILIYDPSAKIGRFYNPLQKMDHQSLVPNLDFIHELIEVKQNLSIKDKYFGFICLADEVTNLEYVDKLFFYCKENGILVGYSTGLYQDWYASNNSYVFTSPPNVFFYGENLTRWEIPFGCFSMTKDIYKPWDSIGTCLIHSSTFSGNTLTIKFIKNLLGSHNIYSTKTNSLTDKERFAKYAKYINPKISFLYHIFKLSPKAKIATDSTIFFDIKGKEKKVFDLVAGSGSALRGHNPDDIIPKVIENHDYKKNYWHELEKKIKEITPFQYAFPAVSGSSAVDIAITLSLMHDENKTRIITFTENYSGKSLIALNVTRIEENRRPFSPLYHDVVEINPFTEEGKKDLVKELESGKIALVWFEIIQGESLKVIPDDILTILTQKREQYSFLIGIDEILSGMFRSGTFLAHQHHAFTPDLVTIGKGTSDMTFPSSAVLITEKLFQKVQNVNSHLVNILQTYYLNQISAHITLNALNWCLENNIAAQVQKSGQMIKELLRDSIKKSSIFEEIRGRGLFLYLKMNTQAFPINLFGENAVELVLSSKCLNDYNILIMNSRLTPPLIIQEEEIKEICQKLNKMISKKPLTLFLLCFKNALKLYSAFFFKKILKKLKRENDE